MIGGVILRMIHPTLIGTAAVRHGTINTNRQIGMGDDAMWILILLGLWLVIVFFRKRKEQKELDQWFLEHQHDRRIDRYKHDTEEEPDKKEHSVFSTDIADMCCDPTNVYFQNIYNQN